MRLVPPFGGFLPCLLLASVAHAEEPIESLGITPSEPQVYGGTPNQECQWPTTVAVTGGGGLCTGALVHPRIVTYAAHCGDGEKQIKFGESSTQAITRQTQRCVTNPGYLGTSNQAQDWAFCILEEPMLDIPYTPPLYGCETEMIAAGLPVTLVGYGDSNVGGAGTKRWGETIVVSTFGNTVNIGASGTGVTTCQGDSGGTAYVRMDDGSYRALSMVSTGLGGCDETTGVHALMHPAVAWIEETAQIDITPCHDVDGTWRPNPSCAGFFAGGSTPFGTWDNFCEGTPRSGPAATCGDSFEAIEDTSAPVVTIGSPLQAEVFDAGAKISIAIDAVDDGYGVNEVWLEINGTEQPIREAYPPYSFLNVQFPDGVYTLVAHATDWAGNEGMSAPVTIGINAEVPDEMNSGTTTGGPGETSSDTDGASESSGSGDTATQEDDIAATGCGCRSQGTRGSWWSLLALGLLLRRRRE